MRREKSMKTLTSGLTRVDQVSLPGWSPRDPPKQRLDKVSDMVECRSQRRS